MTSASALGFADPVALVTGAASSLGQEILAALASEGWHTVGADLIEPTTSSRCTLAASLDIADSARVTALMDKVETTFGRLDAVVNSASIYRTLSAKAPFEAVDPDEFDAVLRVNVRGTWQVMAMALPMLRRSPNASIVNISSMTARTGAVGFPHYVASKAAIEGLTRAAARELGADGIRVNAVAPALTTTEATLERSDESALTRSRSMRTLKRDLVPHDVASVVAWLCGPGGGMITGQTIPVDGGEHFL